VVKIKILELRLFGMLAEIFEMIVQEILISAQQKRTRAARRVENLYFL